MARRARKVTEAPTVAPPEPVTEALNEPDADLVEVVNSSSWAFRYVGDPRNDGEGPDQVTIWGVTFPKGGDVTVTDEWLAERLAGNSHFEAAG